METLLFRIIIQQNYANYYCSFINEFPLENSVTQMTIMVRSSPGTSIIRMSANRDPRTHFKCFFKTLIYNMSVYII